MKFIKFVIFCIVITIVFLSLYSLSPNLGGMRECSKILEIDDLEGVGFEMIGGFDTFSCVQRYNLGCSNVDMNNFEKHLTSIG